MHSTRDVLELLRQTSLRQQVTENRVRHAVRRGLNPPPVLFAGRLTWSDEAVRALAAALGISPPARFAENARVDV